VEHRLRLGLALEVAAVVTWLQLNRTPKRLATAVRFRGSPPSALRSAEMEPVSCQCPKLNQREDRARRARLHRRSRGPCGAPQSPISRYTDDGHVLRALTPSSPRSRTGSPPGLVGLSLPPTSGSVAAFIAITPLPNPPPQGGRELAPSPNRLGRPGNEQVAVRRHAALIVFDSHVGPDHTVQL